MNLAGFVDPMTAWCWKFAGISLRSDLVTLCIGVQNMSDRHDAGQDLTTQQV